MKWLEQNRTNLGIDCLIHTYPRENCDECPYHYYCLKGLRGRIKEVLAAISRFVENLCMAPDTEGCPDDPETGKETTCLSHFTNTVRGLLEGTPKKADEKDDKKPEKRPCEGCKAGIVNGEYKYKRRGRPWCPHGGYIGIFPLADETCEKREEVDGT
jgi:hypothetical protein